MSYSVIYWQNKMHFHPFINIFNWTILLTKKLNITLYITKEGRGQWAAYYASPRYNIFSFVGLTTLGTFIEIWLDGSLSWAFRR